MFSLTSLDSILAQRTAGIKRYIAGLDAAQLASLDLANSIQLYALVVPELDLTNSRSDLQRQLLTPDASPRGSVVTPGKTYERKIIYIPIKGDFGLFLPVWDSQQAPPEFYYDYQGVHILEYILTSEEETDQQIQAAVRRAQHLVESLATAVMAFNHGLEALLHRFIEERKHNVAQQQQSDAERASSWRKGL